MMFKRLPKENGSVVVSAATVFYVFGHDAIQDVQRRGVQMMLIAASQCGPMGLETPLLVDIDGNRPHGMGQHFLLAA